MIIQALARKNAEIAAQLKTKLARSKSSDPVVQPHVVETKLSVVPEMKKLVEDDLTERPQTSYSSMPPFKKGQQQRVAHVPKTEKISPKIPKIESAMKRGSCSPPDNTIATKHVKFDLDFLLTPPSSTVSPNDTDEPDNHAATLIADIVTWDAAKIMDKIPQKRLVYVVPSDKFDSNTHHERFVCMFSFSCACWLLSTTNKNNRLLFYLLLLLLRDLNVALSIACT